MACVLMYCKVRSKMWHWLLFPIEFTFLVGRLVEQGGNAIRQCPGCPPVGRLNVPCRAGMPGADRGVMGHFGKTSPGGGGRGRQKGMDTRGGNRRHSITFWKVGEGGVAVFRKHVVAPTN